MLTDVERGGRADVGCTELYVLGPDGVVGARGTGG
jgi:hypothetical protein